MHTRDLSSRQAVIVGLSGGLGNQLFQFAAGRSLAIRLGCNLALDLTWFDGQSKRQFALDAYKLSATKLRQGTILPRPMRSLVSRSSRRFAKKIHGVKVFREAHFNFSNDFNEINEVVFLEGYWQSERYFKDIRSVLISDFALDVDLPIACLHLGKTIINSEAVCLHIRRGDFITERSSLKVYTQCSLEYYRAAVSIIAKEAKNPHIFIFSDDPNWVRDHVSFAYPSTVVDINGQDRPWLDMWLMSKCKYFVIANSTFSWWGAWLSEAENKIVVAPKNWFLRSDIDTSDLIPSDWILI